MDIKLINKLYEWNSSLNTSPELDIILNDTDIKEIKLVEENHGHEKVYGNERIKGKSLFDINGRVIKSYYKREDKKTEKILNEELFEKKYNKDGYLTKKCITDLIENLYREERYKYDQSGNITQYTRHLKNGEKYSEINLFYHYDSNGNKIKRTCEKRYPPKQYKKICESGDFSFYLGTGNYYEYEIKYINDSKGDLVEEIIDGQTYSHHGYYKNGLLTKKMSYKLDIIDSNQLILDSEVNLTYDKNSNIIKSQVIKKEGFNYNLERIYSDKFLLISVIDETYYKDKMVEIFTDLFEYDENDNLIVVKKVRPDGRTPSESGKYHYFSTRKFSYKYY